MLASLVCGKSRCCWQIGAARWPSTLFKTDLVQRDIKLSRWADLRFDLEHPWEGEVQKVLAASELESTAFDQALGTLGGGNHFAELQKVDEVIDARAFKRFGLGKQQLVVRLYRHHLVVFHWMG